MKIQIKQFYKPLLLVLTVCFFTMSSLQSCKDEPTSIGTFQKEMMGTYLQERPGQFSEFKRLLDTTEVLGLLNAYGEYTLFAPTNEAMQSFYKLKGKQRLSDFTVDTLKRIAYDHIIKNYEVTTDEFIDGLMPYLTMSERFVATSSGVYNNKFAYYINKNAAVVSSDIEVSNGIIQVVNRVIDPSNLNIAQAVASNPRFTIFAEAMRKTGLIDSLYLTQDNSYDPKNYPTVVVGSLQGGGSLDELPASKKYGYTVLVESDETFKANGINSFEDLKAYAAAHVYNEDASDAQVNDLTDRRNTLNKFISYHMINKKLTYVKFIDAYDTDHMLKTFDMYEYIETMCPNTLIEVKKERASGETNLINKSTETGNAIRIIAKDSDAVNGVYHEIDKILVYDFKQAGELSSKRIRMDAASFFPELTNNNMRYYNPKKARSWVYPEGYIKRLKCSPTTNFCYLNACDAYLDYEGDEVYLKGMYDFTMETPPIPAGTYEIRFSYQPTGGRGAAQLYWDGVPCGIPLDLRITANDPLIGYVKPGDDLDDPLGLENDKMMRNRGYMKGPNTYTSVDGRFYDITIARKSSSSLRRILGTYTFTKSGTHKFSVKAVREGQFMMDFLEFVPVEVIENEGID